MNYGSCKNCNKLIKYDKLCLCEDCKAKFLHAVKDYIYENGVKSSKEISAATGVPVRIIDFFSNNGDLNSITNNITGTDKTTTDEEKLRQMALLEALQNSFKPSTEVSDNKEQEESKGEFHFIGRKG